MKKNLVKRPLPITTLFVDIGGVLLTNGWDRQARKLAAETFNLDYQDLEERHRLTFDTYESGKIDLAEYLKRIVFFQKRPFAPAQFKSFMFAQSQPYPDMLELISHLKMQYNVKIAIVSNEPRELNDYRINKFKLRNFVDCFICSCYVHLRKPDADIFRLALDITQTSPDQVAYIEDRAMFVSVAEALGIQGILHTDYQKTRATLAKLGLKDK